MFVLARAKHPADELEAKFKVEGFALHLKKLIEFFYPLNPEANDVLAADYVADWEANRPAITPLLIRPEMPRCPIDESATTGPDGSLPFTFQIPEQTEAALI